MTIKHILFPVDFSEQSRLAAPFVASMAKQFGAQVSLISVIQPYWEIAGGTLVPAGPIMANPADVEQQLEARLNGALHTELAGLEVHRIAQLGDPAQTITQYAQSEGIDLIMMPTHGYGPFRTLLLGSVASKVLHDAECPVWTAAHVKEIPAHKQVQTVLCATDATPKSVPVMQWASEFARGSGGKLRFVHALPARGAWPERQFDREFESTLRQKAREDIERQMQSLGIQAPICLLAGEVSDVVREAATKHAADLVIIGRGTLDETLGRLRTQSYEIIRSAPCPVLSV